MPGLYKKEVLVKPTSTTTRDAVVIATRAFINSFQNASTNKDANGVFIKYFFGDCFDSRDGYTFRIYSDACAAFYSMPSVDGLIKYVLSDPSTIALKSEIPSLNGYATEAYVDTIVDGIVIPSIHGLATETFVTDAIAALPVINLTPIEDTLDNHEMRMFILEETGRVGATFIIE